MAESLAHKFGQIIGDLLELAIEPNLQEFAEQNNLFLDKKGIRIARKGKKLSWTDSKENVHDLDFVLEKGGTSEALGTPVAFIETAWRRYTKHSRNKAQEIQGAILPLAEKYSNSSPFIGVVLAGVFTKGAIAQLQSSGFCVLYFSYSSVIDAFQQFGIDAEFDELTLEDEFRDKIDRWNELPNKNEVAKKLLQLNKVQVNHFFESLKKSVTRYIVVIIVLPLHGQEVASKSIKGAINFLINYSEDIAKSPIAKYEIIIRYDTGDKIEANFRDKEDSIEFLEKYL